MTTVSPASLEETCLRFISKNVEDLCHEEQNHVEECFVPDGKLVFNSPVFLHEQLAENIMKGLSCNGKLTKRTASLFSDPMSCRIRKFDLRRTNNVDYEVVKHLLSQHKVFKIDFQETSLSEPFVFELLNMVSTTLRELDLSHTMNQFYFSSLHQLSCLTHLDISDTKIQDEEFKLACQHLKCLEYVNISNTAISETISFGNLRGQLKTLLAYNTPVAWNDPVQFRDFNLLQVLDISRNPNNMNGYDWPLHSEKVEELLGDQQAMPELVYLDVSGTPRILDNPLQLFLNFHPKLQFLGLCKTGLTSHAKWLPTNIQITGEGSEQQVLSALQAYPDRASYMTEALRGLFLFSKNWTERKPEVLQLVLSPMEKHARDLRVQMAATACVFNIIQGQGGTKEGEVHPTYLRHANGEKIVMAYVAGDFCVSKIAQLVISAMSIFSDKNELLRNCLLILETCQLFRKAKFNFFEAASLALDALCLFSSDPTILQLAIKVCAILSSKISTPETVALGSERNILALFAIAQGKIIASEADFMLSLALSVLWNLTDEAPSTCSLFVQKGGMQMAAQGLKAFREENQEKHIIIKKKILGTLNNIVEVPELRKHLITNEFMDLIGFLLEDKLVQLSYFAGGILSNVLLDWIGEDLLPLSIKHLMLVKLEQAVQSWVLPSEELVAYRSFNPFIQLLHCSMPATQMWALWGILHVCSRNANRYIPLLLEEGIIESVERTIDPSSEGVTQLAQKLLDVVKDFQQSRKGTKT